MKKKILLFLSVIALFAFSFNVAKAITQDHPEDSVNVIEDGETGHGSLNVEYEKMTRMPDGVPNGSSDYKAKLRFTVDPGYYVDSLVVELGNSEIELGFEAGAEQGGFFRRTPFYPLLDYYEFFIPEAATESNKVNVTIHYSRNEAVDINYMLYIGDADGDIHDDVNYEDNSSILVEGYRDGDIVLPESCNNNGCKLLIDFKDQETFNKFKNTPQRSEGDQTDPWFKAEAVFKKLRNDNSGEYDYEPSLINEECIEDGANNKFYCTVIVSRDFKYSSYGTIHLGFNDLAVFSTTYAGFDVEVDINNFSDILSETGGSSVGFSEGSLEKSISIFYGTKTLRLTKKTPSALDKDGESNCPTLNAFDFDSVAKAGNGFGYSVSYNNNVATITIDSYYQEQMILELTLKKNGSNIFSDNVKIVLNRFAFGGNGLSLLEVDSIGRNCNEANNNNTCDQGRYYSTQYRGILNTFYTNGTGIINDFDNFYEVVSIGVGTVELNSMHGTLDVIARNKDFDPYAVALFYDEDDMIVKTDVFKLNHEIDAEGFITSETFNNKYGTYSGVPANYEKDFVFFPHDISSTLIEDIEYFDERHINDTIMHNIILISKDEAEQLGVNKVTMFLVNGEIDENDIPALTFGTGQGVVMRISGNDPGPQNNNGGGND